MGDYVCKFNALELHSSGDALKKFKPVKVGTGYRLMNDDGQVLVGSNGNEYDFSTEGRAETFLLTNLSRVKNMTGSVSVDYIQGLIKNYAENQFYWVLDEIESIKRLNDGEWQAVVDYGGCDHSGFIEYQWLRPSEWLDMPDNQSGVDRISLLVKIDQNKPNIEIRSIGGSDYRVDWGDGSYDDYTGTNKVKHAYNTETLADLPSEGEGIKQVVITIEPTQAGGLTHLKLVDTGNWYHTERPLSTLEARVNCASLTFLAFSYQTNNNTNYRINEALRCLIIGENSIEIFSNLAYRAYGLEYVRFEDGALNSATSLSKALYGCSELRRIDGLTALNATYISELARACQKLEVVTGEGFSDQLTYANLAFYDCRVLKRAFSENQGEFVLKMAGNNAGSLQMKKILMGNGAIEKIILDMPDSVTLNANEIFRDMDAVREIETVNTVIIPSMTTLFYYCRMIESLENFKAVVTGNGLANTFYGTGLKAVPSWIDLTQHTDLYRAFKETNITNFPDLTFDSDVRLYQFIDSASMTETPVITLLNGAQITDARGLYSGIQSLVKLGALDVSAIADGYFNGSFSHIRDLAVVDYYNIDKSMSFSNCNLSASELNKIFNNLLPVTDQTITIAGCAGVDDCDVSIATAKGWTVAV